MRASAIIEKHGAVLLIQREKEKRTYYVLPGGTVEAGETPEQACVREVREETGLAVDSIDTLAIHEDEGQTIHYFRVRAFTGSPKLGGPEREQNSASNRYTLEWVEVTLLPRVDLFPVSARHLITRKKPEPNQPPQTTPASSAGLRV